MSWLRVGVGSTYQSWVPVRGKVVSIAPPFVPEDIQVGGVTVSKPPLTIAGVNVAVQAGTTLVLELLVVQTEFVVVTVTAVVMDVV
jgi:hypothetical protein